MAIGFAWKGLLKLLLFLSKGWLIIITLIILSSAIMGSINEGIEQEDWSIPVKDLGLFLVLSDEKIYKEVKELEKENLELKIKDDLFEFVKEISKFSWYVFKNIFVGLWMLFFNFVLFYKIFLFILGDASRRRRATILSISFMAILQIMVSGIPFRGIYSLGKFIIGIVVGI